MAQRAAVQLVVRGRVQGVGFRWFVAVAAERLGVGGWCRNRADDTVEVLLCGDAAAVEQVVDACRVGPRWADVEDVEVDRDVADPHLGSFNIRG